MDETFEKNLKEVILSWKDKGIKVQDGISENELIKLEDKIAHKFDYDFKMYLYLVNGFEDFECDEFWLSFWSSDRILKEYNDYHPKELICFSDYSINLCSFGFNKIDRKIYTHFQHQEELIFVSNSFAEFIHLYKNDSYSLIK